MTRYRPLLLACLLLAPLWAGAAELDASRLSPLWGVPFAGILLSIALCPLLTPWFWHHHFGKIAAAWALAFLLPFAVVYGPSVAGSSLVPMKLARKAPMARIAVFSPGLPCRLPRM